MTETLALARRSQATRPRDAGPGFEVYDPVFEAVLGSAPRLVLVAETDAHEGPVYVPGEDALYFTTVPQATDPVEAEEPRGDRDSASHPNFRVKLEAIGYGFLVPVFFVSSGIRLNLTGLLHSPSALARVPLFLLSLLVVRSVPALLGLRANGPRPTLALGLLQATSLPFIVAATQIGVVLGKLTSLTAAALVCAGLLSVLIFPPIALVVLRRTEPAPDPAASAPAMPQPVPERHLV